jgi:hypothetical protein
VARETHEFRTVTTWFAYGHHVERNGVIVGRGRNPDPMPVKKAPQQLIFVNRGLISPVEFADAFGLLGWTRIRRVHPEPAEAKDLSQYDMDMREGEPVDWVKAHANTVHIVVDSIGAYQDPVIPKHPPHFSGPVALGEKIVDGVQILAKLRSRRDAWYDLLQALLNPNIEHVPRIFLRGRPRSYFRPRALIEAIYWHLADLLDHPRLVKRCEECGNYFVAGDWRQLYCDAFIRATRSRCSSLRNTHIFREKKESEP